MFSTFCAIDGIDIVTNLLVADQRDVSIWADDDTSAHALLKILGVNKFHQMANTVRLYPAQSQRAAFLKYHAIYVESALKVERDRTYATHIARPHFSEVRSYKVAV